MIALKGWRRALFLGARGDGIAPYQGNVATRTAFCDQVTGTASGTGTAVLMTQMGHTARDTFSRSRIVYFNGILSGTAEVTSGFTAIVEAGIKCPSGNRFRYTWDGGSTSKSVASGAVVFSDTIDHDVVAIDQRFWTRFFITNNTNENFCRHLSNSNQYPKYDNTNFGDTGINYNFGAATINNEILSENVTLGFANQSVPPVMVLAETTKPSVIIIGDSIAWGQWGPGFNQDAVDTGDGYGGIGIVGRSLAELNGGPFRGVPFLNLAVSGQTVANYTSGSAARSQLHPYASHLICQLGTNDLQTGLTATQLVTALQENIWDLNAGWKVFQMTLPPRTTSTDSWATLVNQTTVNQAERANFNSTILGGVTGLTGVFNSNPSLEDGSSGKWQVDGDANKWTGDGVHPRPFSYALVHSEGRVDPALLVYP